MKSKIAQILALIYTWIATVILAGLAAEALMNQSMISFLGVLVGAGFLLPSRFFYRNFEDLYGETSEEIKDKRYRIGLTAFFFLLSIISFTRGIVFPGSGVLNLSFHASAQIFFPLKTLYTNLMGEYAGQLVFNLCRWMLHLMYIYLVTGLTVDLSQNFIEKLR